MTDDEWLNGDDWLAMLQFLPQKASKRKDILYVCAGLREIWDRLPRQASRTAVEVAERMADGKATAEEIDRAAWKAEAAVPGFSSPDVGEILARTSHDRFDSSAWQALESARNDVSDGPCLAIPASIAERWLTAQETFRRSAPSLIRNQSEPAR